MKILTKSLRNRILKLQSDFLRQNILKNKIFHIDITPFLKVILKRVKKGGYMKKISFLLLTLFVLPCICLFAGCGETFDYTVKAGESIQSVIDAAETGKSILIKAGTYNEQITISNKKLTIMGEDGTIISGPEDYSNLTLWERETGDTTGHSSQGMYGIVRILAGADVTIKKLTIKSELARTDSVDNNAGRSAGVFVANSRLEMMDVKVSGFRLKNEKFGIQTGYGLYVGGANASTIIIDKCEFVGFQKGGVYALTTNSDVTVKNSTIQGAGDTDLIAQNGICACGKVAIQNNTFKNLKYLPDGTSACAILLKSSVNQDNITGNKFENVQVQKDVY